jgi:hypothetical protein
VVQDLYLLSAEKPDTYWAPNTARADRHLEKLPPTWAAGRVDPAATRELFALLREGKAEPACDLAVRQLLRGVGGQALWDAVHLATAEVMVRHKSGWGLASRPLQANTSSNALHYAFRTCTAPRTRLLALLQAIAWAAGRTGGDLADPRDVKIAELPAAPVPAGAEAVADVFAVLPSRTYRWDAEGKKAVLGYGKREGADEACRKVFVLARERPEFLPLFERAAHSWLCRKASDDAHDYKFLAAILEKNPHRDVRGLACLRLAQFLNGRVQRLDLLRERPDMARRYEDLFGKDYFADLLRRDRAKAVKEAEALFERAAEQYGDVKVPYGDTVGVNTNESDVKKVKAVLDKEKLNWRSFATGDTIPARWNNPGTPLYYVIDPKGVIRHKRFGSPGEKAIDRALEKLIG